MKIINKNMALSFINNAQGVSAWTSEANYSHKQIITLWYKNNAQPKDAFAKRFLDMHLRKGMEYLGQMTNDVV